MIDKQTQMENFKMKQAESLKEFEQKLDIQSELVEYLGFEPKITVVSSYKRDRSYVTIYAKDRNEMAKIMIPFLKDQKMLPTIHIRNSGWATFYTKDELEKEYGDKTIEDKNGIYKALDYYKKDFEECIGFRVQCRYWDHDSSRDLTFSFKTEKYHINVVLKEYNFYGNEHFVPVLLKKKSIKSGYCTKTIDIDAYRPNCSCSKFNVSDYEIRSYCTEYDDYNSFVKLMVGIELEV